MYVWLTVHCKEIEDLNSLKELKYFKENKVLVNLKEEKYFKEAKKLKGLQVKAEAY